MNIYFSYFFISSYLETATKTTVYYFQPTGHMVICTDFQSKSRFIRSKCRTTHKQRSV